MAADTRAGCGYPRRLRVPAPAAGTRAGCGYPRRLRVPAAAVAFRVYSYY